MSLRSCGLLSGDPFHRLGELDLSLCHTATVVSRKRLLDVVVDVEPLGMMVELLGNQRRARHEAERRVEVLERELLADGIAALDLAPAFELGERALAGLTGQFLRHGRFLSIGPIVPRIAARPPLAKAHGAIT